MLLSNALAVSQGCCRYNLCISTHYCRNIFTMLLLLLWLSAAMNW
jgi:hypothetical protein